MRGRLFRVGLGALAFGLAAATAGAYDVQITPMNGTVPEGIGNANFQVTLLGCPNAVSDVIFPVTVIGITATEGVDVLPPSESFLILGEASQQDTFFVPIVQDQEIEADETFEILLDLGGGANNQIDCDDLGIQGPGQTFYQTLVTIADDDQPAPTPTLSIDDVTVVEGDSGTTAATFTASLSVASNQATTFTVSTRDGSATVADSDYTAKTENLQIAAGQTTTQFTVDVIGDETVEPDESFFVDISAIDGADPGDLEGEGTITNDDQTAPPPSPLPEVSIGDVEVVEGDTGTTIAQVLVSLSFASDGPVQVDVATRDGTAIAGEDYEAKSETITFPPGSTERSVDLIIIPEQIVENDETFFAELSNAMSATIAAGGQIGTITIINDDQGTPPPPNQPELRISNVTVNEGNVGTRDADFTVTLEPASENQVMVGFRTENGTAVAGQDYEARSGSLHFAPGQTAHTISVPVRGDTVPEPTETFFVVLEGAVGATIADGRGRGNIRDDDVAAPPAEIGLQGDERRPASPGTDVLVEVLATRDGDPAANVEVTWSVEGDATLVGGDTSTSGENGIAGKTVRLGTTPGPVVVTARTSSEATVQVIFDVSRPLAPLFPNQPGERSVAEALDRACANSEGLAGLCDYLFAINDEDARRAISELTPKEASGMGRLALEGARSQLSNIDNHLSAVRRSGRLGGSRVALELGGRSWEPTELWRIARGQSPLELPGLDAALSLAPTEPTPVQDEDADAALSRSSRGAFFASGRVSTGERDASDRETGFEFDTSGITAGFDYRVGPGLVMGVAAGYLDTATDFGRDDGNLDIEGYSLSGFLTRYGDRAYVDFVGSWGRNDYSLLRHVDLPVLMGGSQRLSVQGAPSGDQLAATLSFGAEWGGAASFGLFGGVSWIDATVDRFTESGASPAGASPVALAMEEQSLESRLGEVGFEVSYAASTSWGVFLPQLRVAYLNEFEDDARLIRGRFALDGQGNDFVIPTEVQDRNYLDVGIGFTATFARGRSFYLFWETDLERDDLESSHLTGGFRLEL